MRFCLPGMVIALAVSPAAASEITIALPADIQVETIDVSYLCDGQDLSVTYINAGSVSLATLSIEGEFVVASNVIAASGAKYSGGRYVWWTKGNDAQLFDAMQAEDADAVMSCTAKG